jgi:medium-chain acyl-[acyl-carrier-protein] hydrolase
MGTLCALEAQGGGATTVQTNPELAALARRIFDADMTLSKRYYYQADNPLTCPVTVFGGLDDPICSAEALRAWQTQTTGPFALHPFAW